MRIARGGRVGLRLIWNSQPGDTHGVCFSTDPHCPQWMEAADIPSGGETTAWTLVSIAPFPPYQLFRIQMK